MATVVVLVPLMLRLPQLHWRSCGTTPLLLSRMRHDGCGGLAGKAELMTGIEAASGRPVRRIVLMGG